MIILRHLAGCRATDTLRKGGRPHYKYVKDERRKRKTHNENENDDDDDDEEMILIPSIYCQPNEYLQPPIGMYCMWCGCVACWPLFDGKNEILLTTVSTKNCI